MQKLISYPLSVLYYLCFFLTLVIFHPIQWFCFNVFGYQAHKKSVDTLQFCLIRCAHILGTRFTLTNPHQIETNQPLIIVANHQSLHDIYPITWYMRKYHPKFISKIELGKGIPSVSYNLKHGGSALINRKDPKQALPEIKKVAELINNNNYSVVIFPEGTRSKTGTPKPFAVNGLKMLYKFAPDAYFLPITINNSWKMLKSGKFPMGLGTHITFPVHKPLKVSTFVDKQDLINSIESAIKSKINS